MSKAVQQNKDALRYLSIAKPKYIKAILKVSDKTLLKGIQELAKNGLYTDLGLDQDTIKRLKVHKRTLKRLADTKGGHATVRRYLLRSGWKILPTLIPPLLEVLHSLITDENDN